MTNCVYTSCLTLSSTPPSAILSVCLWLLGAVSLQAAFPDHIRKGPIVLQADGLVVQVDRWVGGGQVVHPTHEAAEVIESQTVGRPNKTYIHKGPMINQKASWIAVSVYILNHYQISPQNNSGMQKSLPWLVRLGLDWPANSICFRGAFWISQSFSNKIWTRWHSLIRVSALCIVCLKIFKIRIGIIATDKNVQWTTLQALALVFWYLKKTHQTQNSRSIWSTHTVSQIWFLDILTQLIGKLKLLFLLNVDCTSTIRLYYTVVLLSNMSN